MKLRRSLLVLVLATGMVRVRQCTAEVASTAQNGSGDTFASINTLDEVKESPVGK